jgi:hypothetical protein
MRQIHRIVAYRIKGIEGELTASDRPDYLNWNVWRDSAVSDAAWRVFQIHILMDCMIGGITLTPRDHVDVIMWALHYRIGHLLEHMMMEIERKLTQYTVKTYIDLVTEYSPLFPIDKFASIKKQQDPFYYGLDEITMRIEKVCTTIFDITEGDTRIPHDLYLRVKSKKAILENRRDGQYPFNMFYPQNLILSRATISSSFVADLTTLLLAPETVSPSYPHDMTFCGVPCHRAILNISSEYFKSMSQFDTSVKDATMCGEIKTKRAATAVLLYLYAGCVKMIYSLDPDELGSILTVYDLLFPSPACKDKNRNFKICLVSCYDKNGIYGPDELIATIRTVAINIIKNQ